MKNRKFSKLYQLKPSKLMDRNTYNNIRRNLERKLEIQNADNFMKKKSRK